MGVKESGNNNWLQHTTQNQWQHWNFGVFSGIGKLVRY